MKKKSRFISAMLIFIIAALLFSGCGENTQTPPTNSSSGSTANNTSTAQASTAQPDKITLPIGNVTLTYFMPLNPKVTKTRKDYSEINYYQELERRTGIKIKWIHPAMGNESEQLNLLIASGDLPDLVWQGWGSYPGGFTKAIQDGIAIDLREPIQKWAPNISKVYQQWPDVLKDSSTDDGKIFFFPVIYVDMEQKSQFGFFIRQDWIEKLGLELPETIDEWHTVLSAFKTKDPNGNGKADEIPVSLVGGANTDTQIVKFANAWKLDGDFVNWDGRAVYSPLQPEFKEFVETMRKWYAEGLIDPQYVANDQKTVDNNLSTGIAGTGYERNSKLGALTGILAKTDPDAVLNGTRYPVLKKGDTAYNVNTYFVPINNNGTTITSSNKHVEESVKWLDYCYSEEGYYLGNWGYDGLNWGKPGTEITKKGPDGLPYLTDYVLKNPDGLSMDETICGLTPGGLDSPRRYDPRLYTQRMMTYPVQLEAQKRWDDVTCTLRFPNVSFTDEEASEMKSLRNDITTYKREMMNKFIMGQIPMTEYDTFISTMKFMGADRMVKIYQAAFDRYKQRK